MSDPPVLELETEDDMEVEDPGGSSAPNSPPDYYPMALVAVSVGESTYVDQEPPHSSSDSRGILVEIEDMPSEGENHVILPNTSKKRPLSQDSEDDGSLCPICLDFWSNTGEHRLCALKCGHLFGYSCVNRWLSGQTKRTCPTCKKRVGKGDIRNIYAKKLTAVDTVELDMLKSQLAVAVAERNKAQADLAKYICREQVLGQEIALLKARILSHTRPAGNLNHNVSTSAQRNPELVRYFMDKSMEVCKYAQSRVFDVNSETDLLVASMKSPTNLFMDFGLKKINISGYRSLAFIPVHHLQIRDIAFHPSNNWVLTASLDRSFKVVANNTNTVIYQFKHQMPLWSCCWDSNNANLLYVGTQTGAVVKYDVRQLSQALATLVIEGDTSPVVSVASIPSSPGEVLPQGGVVSCKLNSMWIYENSGAQCNRHPVSLEGPFVSMKYQETSRQLLVSSRPNSRISHSRHTLCTLARNNETVNCNIVHTFQGGGMQKLLSKSCFLSHNSDYVAAHQENCRSVFLWSINTGERVCSIPARDTVLDLKGLQNQNGNFLVSLTDKKLEFFKFI